MKSRNSILLEVEKENNIYRLELPIGAPLGEAFHVVSEFRTEIVRMINESVKADEPKKDEEKKESVSTDE